MFPSYSSPEMSGFSYTAGPTYLTDDEVWLRFALALIDRYDIRKTSEIGNIAESLLAEYKKRFNPEVK